MSTTGVLQRLMRHGGMITNDDSGKVDEVTNSNLTQGTYPTEFHGFRQSIQKNLVAICHGYFLSHSSQFSVCSQSHRASLWHGNALDFYPKGIRFESWPDYRLFLLRCSYTPSLEIDARMGTLNRPRSPCESPPTTTNNS